MVIRKTFIGLMICAMFVLTISGVLFPRGINAQSAGDDNLNQRGCRKSIVGTYVGETFLDGGFVGRRVISLTKDGNFFVIDSNQGGNQGVPSAAQSFPNNRFTSGEGVWECTQSGEITATTLNFNFPSPESGQSVTTARGDYQVKFDPQTQTLQGIFQIRTFNLEENPLDNNIPVGEGEPFTFSFTGQRVTIHSLATPG